MWERKNVDILSCFEMEKKYQVFFAQLSGNFIFNQVCENNAEN